MHQGTPYRRRRRRLRRRRIRVLLVDRWPATRLGIRTSLRQVKYIEIVGEAGDAKRALRLNVGLHPDVVMLDIELAHEGDGLDLCKLLKASPANRPRVLVYTARNSREQVAAASLAGADGYLHKGVDCGSISEVVYKVHRGERTWALGHAEETSTELRSLIDRAPLTPKEGEILALLLGRHTNAEVAEQLCLSRNTVKSHVHNILRKLGLENRQDIWRANSSPKR
jgi:DNA-binding NarL/FixJ family response regulator